MNETVVLTQPTRFRRAVNRLFAALEREPVVMAFGAALAVTCVVYRVSLATTIFSHSAQPFSLQPEQVTVTALLKTFGNDWLVILALVSVHLGLKSWLRWRAPRWAAAIPTRVGEALAACAAALGFALILRTHGQLLLELESGLTVTMVLMARTGFGLKDFFRLFTTADWLFLAVPFVAFAFSLAGASWLRRVAKPLVFGGTVVALLVQIVPSGKPLTRELRSNPLAYFLRDALKAPLRTYFGKANPYLGRPDLPGAAQMRSIQFVDETFVTGTNFSSARAHESMPSAKGKPWNVLFFVLESTGADYIFDTSSGNELPMPFLHRMADEGLYLANHHATCDGSPSAAFSIFTGLYPLPAREPFSLQKNAAIPVINHYLGSNYNTFLVTPASLTYCFPEHLFRNNGFSEMNHLATLPRGSHPDVTELARNELDAVSFLLDRLDHAREPFFGIYWSFIPHHPYSDYGPEFRVLPDLSKKRNLYYNNLRALDVQLRRVHEHLVKSHLAERTLLVFVGDHGEAFGQHPAVWGHSFGSYSEMYRAPAIFWQPQLIPPRVVRHPTSHVDILPTLLDSLGVSWDESRFQGESALREPARKYIFAMDSQAYYVTAIDRQMNKVSVCYEDGEALAFNLAKDPAEKLPLSEDLFPTQIEAVLKFNNYQARLVEDYNAAILAGREYPPPTRVQTDAQK